MTEKEYAIALWTMIKYQPPVFYSPDSEFLDCYVDRLKGEYCEENCLDWEHDCYLCNKYSMDKPPSGANCPINATPGKPCECMYYNQLLALVEEYNDTGDWNYHKQSEWMHYCDQIVEAIEKEND